MRILLTNDDGIYAPGLRALREQLLPLGQVTVVAPATEQSATGHSVTLLTPLLVNQIFEEAHGRFDTAEPPALERRAESVRIAMPRS